MTTEYNYLTLKKLAKVSGCSPKKLIAMSSQNDPFFCGSKTNILMAEWFKEVWESFNCGYGTHLRRVHYKLVSIENPVKDDGTRYTNTINDWSYLCQASKYARILGYINPDCIVDHKNSEPHIYTNYRGSCPDDLLNCELDFNEWELPYAKFYDIADPEFLISGYDYNNSYQKYHIEIFIEKSTMDDILNPLCRELRINFSTSEGFQSITRIREMIKRVKESGKEGLVFYISDFDPAGDKMPNAVSRQIEYWNEGKADIKLKPIILTQEQVKEYDLPTIPIKDSDKRKEGFQEKYDSDAVELDSLEALHPGVFEEIVRKNIEPYIDTEIESNMADTESEAETIADDIINAVMEKHEEEIEEIKAKLQEKMNAYNEDIKQYGGRLKKIYLDIKNELEKEEIILPLKPELYIDDPDQDWLFDSSRDYIDQLNRYKKKVNE